MMSRILFVLGATVALLPGMARAEWGEWGGEFDRPGFYVGLGGLYVENGLIENQLSDLLPTGVEFDNGQGVSAQLGYRAVSFLATELEYDYVSPMELSANGVTLASIETHLLTANVKAILPIWRFQPYLLGGIGFVNSRVDSATGGPDEHTTDLAGRVGGGVDIHLTPRISLDLGADVVFANSRDESASDVDYLANVFVGAGLRYRFWGFSGE